jgi:hypothetical protein
MTSSGDELGQLVGVHARGGHEIGIVLDGAPGAVVDGERRPKAVDWVAVTRPVRRAVR